MTLPGFDAWGLGPSPAAAKAAGFAWRTWYSSYDVSKDGPADGPAQYAGVGIWSVTNFETTTDRVLSGGAAAGQADMAHAIAEYAARGMPQGAVVILSADELIQPANFPQALVYYRGARAAAAGRYLTGCYGEQALIAYLKAAGAIDVGWRSASTSFPGGASTQGCDLIQGDATSVGGVQVDFDTALVAFFGQWMPGVLAPHSGGSMTAVDLTPAAVTAVHDAVTNEARGIVATPVTPSAGRSTIGIEVLSMPVRHQQLLAAIAAVSAKVDRVAAQAATELSDLTSVTAEVKQLEAPTVNVDAATLQAALEPLVPQIAAAVVAQIGADLKAAG